jgi:tetratricopeptide (TPR) repeat protein
MWMAAWPAKAADERGRRRRLVESHVAIQDLLGHDSFPDAERVLRDQPELLSEEVDHLFDELAAEVEGGATQYPVEAIVQLRGFLRRCRSVGLDAVFPPDHPDIDPQVVAIIRPDMQEADDAEAAFEREGDASVLTCCAAAWRRIVREPSLDSAYPGLKAALLNNAGATLLRTYWARGEMNDLRDGLDLLDTAVKLTPLSSAHRAHRLGNLGVAFREVHLRTGDVEALDRATGLLREAVRTLDSSPGSPAASEVLSNLALVLRDYYIRTGNPDDLADAITHSERACRESESIGCRVMLGDLLGQRYETTGSHNDLTRAVELLTEAVSATPSASPDRPRRLVDLAITLLHRHAALGNPDDLSVALQLCSEAVQTIPPASPDRPACLAQWSLACYRRYESTGLLDDLDRAAAGLDEAIRTAQPNEFNVPGWRVNLATVLFVRSRRTLHPADLDRAITLYETAAADADGFSGDRFATMNNLGNALRDRARKTGGTADLDRAIEMLRAALTITPEGSPRHATTLTNLGAVLRDRYAATGSHADLEEALTRFRIAVDISADGDIDRSRRLFAFAQTILDLAGPGSDNDRNVAIDAYRRGCADGVLADPESTLTAAQEWGNWAASRRCWSEAADAYDAAASALSALVGAQVLREHQENWLRDAFDLPGRAAHTSAMARRLPAAVVAFERTRAAILSESLGADHADLIRLDRNDPQLAARYTRAVGHLRAVRRRPGPLATP